MWGKQAEAVGQYCRKGKQVYVEGRLQTRKWQKDGVDQYSTEIVLQGFNGTLTLLDGKSDGGSQQGGQATGGQQGGGFGGVNDTGQGQPGGGYGAGAPGGGGKNFDKDLDDDIPFNFCERNAPWDTV